jgi:anti-sigma-K factor RskA
MLTYRRRSAWRLLALVFALVAGLAIALGAMLSAAQAAPIGMLKQFKVPRLVAARSTSRGLRTGISGLPSPS